MTGTPIAWLWLILLVIYVIGIPIIAGICFRAMVKDDEEKKDEKEDGSSLITAILVGCIWPFALLMAFGLWLHDKLPKDK